MNNILVQLNENVSLNTIKLMNATGIANAYVANYIAALVLIRSRDEKSMRLLNDKTHVKLKSFSSSMSRPNFWGFVIFNSDIKNIKKIISPSAADELAQSAGRIVTARRIKLQTYTTLSDEKINWTDAAYSIKLLKVRFDLGYSKLENMANGIYHWESLDEMAKGDLLYNAFSYLLQSDNESDLLPRLRALTNNKYLTVNSIVSTMGQKLNKVFRMMEDEGGDTGTGDIGTGDPGPGVKVTTPDGTSAKDIGNLPMKFEKGKIIRRRKRNWKVRKWKDPLVKNKGLGDYSNVKIN